MKIECASCGVIYELKVLDKFTSPSDVKFCAFCGEELESEDEGKDDED